MKKLSMLMLCLLMIGGTFLGGCKKGEDDPFISLRSRDARLKGDWKLSKMTEIESGTHEVYNPNTMQYETQSYSYSTNYDGTTMTYASGANTNSSPFSTELKIEDDGKYTMTTVDDGERNVSKGNWYWLDSDKKKSYLYLSDFEGEVYIRQLKNDEMVWTMESADGDDVSSTEMTWEAK